MVQTVTIEDIESVLFPLLNEGKIIRLFYPLYDLEELHADYSAEILIVGDIFFYNFGGHGIGENHKQFTSYFELLSNIKFDNERFNKGREFHFISFDKVKNT